MRILILDPDPEVRQTYRHALATEFQEAMFGEAASARQVAELLQRVRWDVVVIGETQPSVRIIGEMRELEPRVPLVVRAAADSEEAVLGAGATALAGDVAELLIAVRSLLGDTVDQP